MIEHARGGDGSGGPPVRLLQTSLSPHAAKLAINVDFGDTARLEVRDCGCTLGALGLRTHLSEIRSHEKLSTEGVSLARSAVLSLLEVELPARFGGGPLDYQLVEREAADGQTRLVLRIHPNVGPVNEPAVTHAFLSGLGGADFLSASQAHLLRRAASLTIERQPPLATHAGKVLPFQAARHARTE